MMKSTQFRRISLETSGRVRSRTPRFKKRRYLGLSCGLLPGLLVALAAQTALADVSIVNLVFSDSNSVQSVVCYNGHGSQGPAGLNCSPPGFVLETSPSRSPSFHRRNSCVISRVIGASESMAGWNLQRTVRSGPRQAIGEGEG